MDAEPCFLHMGCKAALFPHEVERAPLSALLQHLRATEDAAPHSLSLRGRQRPAAPTYNTAPRFRTRHALHEHASHRQKSNSPQVSSQERRAAIVRLMYKL